MQRQKSPRLLYGLLALYAALFAACFVGLGPQTLAWSLNRALGLVAYLVLALSVTFGALLGSRYATPWLNRALQGGWHSLLSVSALGLGSLHGLLLTVDAQYPQPLWALLVPGASGVLPFAVGLGTLGLYGLLLVWASTHWRKHLPAKLWKPLHLSAYPAFGLITAHGILAGSDHLPWLYAAALGGVVYTFGLRFIEERQRFGAKQPVAS